MSRFISREKAVNKKEQYDKLFKKRGVRRVVQYRSPTATYVSDEDLLRVECYEVVWAATLTLELLAQQYYGNFAQWWVIAAFNRKPTESHFKVGDIVRIPRNLSLALQVLG